MADRIRGLGLSDLPPARLLPRKLAAPFLVAMARTGGKELTLPELRALAEGIARGGRRGWYLRAFAMRRLVFDVDLLHDILLELNKPEEAKAVLTAQQRIEARAVLAAKPGIEAEGKAEGKAEALLVVLQQRFGQPSAAVKTRIVKATPAELDGWLGRVLSAPSLDALFDEPAWR